MKFFDGNSLKFIFQFLAVVSLGIFAITYISGLNSKADTAAGVIDVRQ